MPDSITINNMFPSEGKPGKLVTLEIYPPLEGVDNAGLKVLLGEIPARLPSISEDGKFVYFTVPPDAEEGMYDIIFHVNNIEIKSNAQFHILAGGTIHRGDSNKVEIESVTPINISIAAHPLISISGTNLGQVTRIYLGNSIISQGLIKTPTSIRFRLPGNFSQTGRLKITLIYGPDSERLTAATMLNITN